MWFLLRYIKDIKRYWFFRGGAVQWPSKIVYLNSGVKCPLMAASLTGRCTASLTGDGSKLVEGGLVTDFIENREQGRESFPGL